MPSQNDADTQKLTWLLKRLQVSEDYCRPYFERAKRYYRLYRFGTAINAEDWPYVNRTCSRDILAFTEDATALMIQTLFGSSPFYSVIPRYTSELMKRYTGIDPIAIATQLETFIDNQISTEESEFFEEAVDFFKEGAIHGNSYLGVYPRFDMQNRYMGPIFKSIGFWDVLPIAGARRMTKARGVFVREFMAKEEAQELAEKFGYPGAADGLKGWNQGVERKWHEDLLNDLGITNWQPDVNDVELMHYFSGGHVISMADRAIIVRDSNMPITAADGVQQVVTPFPYDQPIVQFKYIPLPQEWFAMGIPEVLEVLQEDKNLIRSARRDNLDLIINKVLKARAGADINYDLIKYYAGAIWPLENLNDIEPMDQTDISQSSYAEESMRSADMENALSFFGYARGMTPTHEERPTTVIKLQQASMNRLDLSIKLTEFTTLQNIAKRVILLGRRFMKKEEYEFIIGDQDAGFLMLPEDALNRYFVVKPVGSSVTHAKEVRQQQLAMASQVLEKIAPVALSGPEPFQVNWYQAAKSGLDALDIKNLDQLLVKLEPQQAQMMITQQQMAQMQQVKYGEDMKINTAMQIDNNKARNQIAVDAAKPKPEGRKNDGDKKA